MAKPRDMMATERRRCGQRIRDVKVEHVECIGIGTEESESAQGENNVIRRDGCHVLFDEDGLFTYNRSSKFYYEIRSCRLKEGSGEDVGKEWVRCRRSLVVQEDNLRKEKVSDRLLQLLAGKKGEGRG